MPSYEYRCEECGESFVRREHIDDHGGAPPPCPKCKSTRVRPVMSSFYAQTAKKS